MTPIPDSTPHLRALEFSTGYALSWFKASYLPPEEYDAYNLSASASAWVGQPDLQLRGKIYAPQGFFVSAGATWRHSLNVWQNFAAQAQIDEDSVLYESHDAYTLSLSEITGQLQIGKTFGSYQSNAFFVGLQAGRVKFAIDASDQLDDDTVALADLLRSVGKTDEAQQLAFLAPDDFSKKLPLIRINFGVSHKLTPWLAAEMQWAVPVPGLRLSQYHTRLDLAGGRLGLTAILD